MFNNNPELAIRNREITKAYLRKPLVILTAITFAILTIYKTICCFRLFGALGNLKRYGLNASSELGFTIVLLVVFFVLWAVASLLITIGLFSMYSASQDRNPQKQPATGIALFSGGSLCSALALVIASVFIIFLMIRTINEVNSALNGLYSTKYFSLSISSPAYVDSSELSGFYTALIIFILVAVVYIIYGISLFSTANTLKKNIINGSLSTSGCTALGVSSIILSISTFIIFIIAMSNNSAEANGLAVILMLAFLLMHILISVFAFGYKSHVFAAANAPFYGAPETPYTSAPQAPVYPSNPYADPYTPAQDPVPAQTPATPSPAASATKFCTSCGNKLNEGQIFCGKCGTKIR